MISHERLDAALGSADVFQALRATVLELAGEGHTKDEIYSAFEELVQRVRDKHQGAESEEEDIVLDVMDLIVSWCRPDAQLL